MKPPRNHNKAYGNLEVTIMGESPDGKLSGGARINTWLGVLRSRGVKISLVVFQAYSNKFRIEKKRTDDLLTSTTIYFPEHWPRLVQLQLSGAPVKAADAVGWLVDYAGPMEDALKTAWKVASDGAHGLKRR